MRKLIFLIPFMLIIYSCADTNSGTSNTVSSDSSGGSSMISQGGSSGGSDSGTSNPASDGSAGGNTGETVDTGSDTDGNTEGNTDLPVDTGGETSTGGETGGDTGAVVDTGGETGGNTEVTVNPGGDTGDVVVDVDVPGGDGSDVTVIIPPSTEDPEYNNFTNTIFDYINKDNLYYRSTLSLLEQKVYDRLYESFQTFYGRNEEESEECTAGVLCHATDVFIAAKCIDDETGFELTNLSQEDKANCTPEEVQKQYKDWADKHCINSETGEARLNASTGAPVCGEENYNYKYAEWLYRQTTGVPVGFLDMKEIFVAIVFQNYTKGNIMSVNDIIKSIEEKLMLDLSNLYLFKAGGQVSNSKYSLLNYYKIQTVSPFSSNDEIKAEWVSQMKKIQERVYYSIKNYTRFKFDTFDDLVYNYKTSSYSKKYNENGAADITGVITEQFNGKGLARLFAFACQISSDYQCAYVEGKANYSTGFGNHGGAEFDHAWVRVKNTFTSECSGDIIIDPLRFYEEKETIPYLCMSDAENAGYKPSVE